VRVSLLASSTIRVADDGDRGSKRDEMSLMKVHAAAAWPFSTFSVAVLGVLVQSAPPEVNRPDGARDNDRFHARLFGFGLRLQDQPSAGIASDRAEM
jgi:hypothetical protein